MLVADKEFTCLSNRHIRSEKEVDSMISAKTKKAVLFNTTPSISTYLLAFVIGKLNYIEANEFRVPL